MVAQAGESALELLRRENELLRQTLEEVATEDGAIAGVVGSSLANTDLIPEDYWSPALEVPAGGAFVEEYGAMTPVPDHDGTECFKWDNTLWQAADHFKVGGALADDYN